MKQLPIHEVRERMVLAEDVRSPKGLLLLRQGTRLDQWHLKALTKSHVRLLQVIEEADQSQSRGRDPGWLRDRCIAELIMLSRQEAAAHPPALSRCEALILALADAPALLGLLSAFEARDPATFQHGIHTFAAALLFGIELGLPDAAIGALAYGLLFHDIGKLFLTTEVLSSAGIPPSASQRLARFHTELGYACLQDYPLLDEQARDVVLHHHEAFDGSGYPDRLQGPAILPLTRIAAVIDLCTVYWGAAPEAVGDLPPSAALRLDAALTRAFLTFVTRHGPWGSG